MYLYYWVFGENTDWESWSEKFLLHGKYEGEKILLVNSGSTSGEDKITTQGEYEKALKSDMDLNKKILK